MLGYWVGIKTIEPRTAFSALSKTQPTSPMYLLQPLQQILFSLSLSLSLSRSPAGFSQLIARMQPFVSGQWRLAQAEITWATLSLIETF